MTTFGYFITGVIILLLSWALVFGLHIAGLIGQKIALRYIRISSLLYLIVSFLYMFLQTVIK